jgi:prepilin-type N-terminal cleavage/methylation domain-containing protein
MRLTASRRGFSLAEIMVALVILSVIVMGLASTTITFMHETTVDYSRVRASTSADTRIAEIRGWPDYTAISATFAGVQSNYPEPGWTRTTTVARDTSVTTGCGFPTFPACPNNDITHVTVTVTSPTLSAPVSRSISIAAF